MAKNPNPETKPTRKKRKWNLVCSLLIALILYVGIHMLIRTEGTRSMIADRISIWTKLPVSLGHCQATPLLGLRLDNLEFPGVKIPEARIKFNVFAGFLEGTPWIEKLILQEPELKLKRDAKSGQWEPFVLHKIGSHLGAVVGANKTDIPAAENLPRFPESVLNAKTIFLLERAKVHWLNESGIELAYITSIDSSVKVVAFSDRKAIQTFLKCGHIKMASGKLLRDLELETVKIEGYDPVLILKLTDSDGEYDGFQTKNLWLDLRERLAALSKI